MHKLCSLGGDPEARKGKGRKRNLLENGVNGIPALVNACNTLVFQVHAIRLP